ncbi:MAG: phage tail tube protein [Sphingomonas sp.]
MATERGADWRIEVKGAGAEEFVPIGGEISFDWSRSSNEIDESTKDDGMYGSTSYGQQKISIRVNGNAKLPDPGLSRISTVAKTSPPETVVRIVKGAIAKFEGLVAVGNFSTTHPKDGPVTYTFDMANKGAPTVDNFAAAE